MKLYVDDDTAKRKLIAMLRSVGHQIVSPLDIGTSGQSDARHLALAIRQQLVLLTRNHDDFLDLHEVVQASQGTHPGKLIIRSDNNPARDMTSRGIVTAIGKLEASGVLLSNNCFILNHWR